MTFLSEAHMKKCHGTLIKLLFICIFRMSLLIPHDTQQIIHYNMRFCIDHFTSSFFFSCVISDSGYLQKKKALESFFCRGGKTFYLKVCGWGLWIKPTNDRLIRKNAYILVNNWTQNQKKKKIPKWSSLQKQVWYFKLCFHRGYTEKWKPKSSHQTWKLMNHFLKGW